MSQGSGISMKKRSVLKTLGSLGLITGIGQVEGKSKDNNDSENQYQIRAQVAHSSGRRRVHNDIYKEGEVIKTIPSGSGTVSSEKASTDANIVANKEKTEDTITITGEIKEEK